LISSFLRSGVIDIGVSFQKARIGPSDLKAADAGMSSSMVAAGREIRQGHKPDGEASGIWRKPAAFSRKKQAAVSHCFVITFHVDG
jgi:hypothetical protein